MTTHAVVRTDRMAGQKVPSLLISGKYQDSNADAAIDNGMIVKIGGLMTGEREIFKLTAPAKGTPMGKIGLVATPEVMYDERLKNLTCFYNEAGVPVRVYILHSGDIFSVTEDAFSAVPTDTNKVVELVDNSIKLKGVSSGTEATTTVGTFLGTETVGKITYYVIQVD